MRRSLWILFAVAVGTPALLFLATRSASARVLGKDERVEILPSTGQWYHTYFVHAGTQRAILNGAVVGDTFTVQVAQASFDAARVGTRVKLRYLALSRRLSWFADSASALKTIANIIEPHFKSYRSPVPVSPLDAQTPGLARVIAIHSVKRRTPFWRKRKTANATASQWMHLVEVEFWAQRVRTLVRTIDVVDAGSIPGLHSGDIVQMHFDQRDPRIVRLDDGRRTFSQLQ